MIDVLFFEERHGTHGTHAVFEISIPPDTWHTWTHGILEFPFLQTHGSVFRDPPPYTWYAWDT
jgi:hypothetical protein